MKRGVHNLYMNLMFGLRTLGIHCFKLTLLFLQRQTERKRNTGSICWTGNERESYIATTKMKTKHKSLSRQFWCAFRLGGKCKLILHRNVAYYCLCKTTQRHLARINRRSLTCQLPFSCLELIRCSELNISNRRATGSHQESLNISALKTACCGSQ